MAPTLVREPFHHATGGSTMRRSTGVTSAAFRQGGHKPASLDEPDLFQVGHEVPVVRVAGDLSVAELDDRRSAHLKRAVGGRYAGKVFGLATAEHPLDGPPSAVGRDKA